MVTMAAVSYHCEGCGMHVFAFGIARVPAHGFCSVCAWLCEHLSPEEMATYRKAAGLLMLERDAPADPPQTPMRSHDER